MYLVRKDSLVPSWPGGFGLHPMLWHLFPWDSDLFVLRYANIQRRARACSVLVKCKIREYAPCRAPVLPEPVFFLSWRMPTCGTKLKHIPCLSGYPTCMNLSRWEKIEYHQVIAGAQGFCICKHSKINASVYIRIYAPRVSFLVTTKLIRLIHGWEAQGT